MEMLHTQGTKESLKLTSKEIEICSLLAEGLTAKQIARRLNISYRTVQQKVYQIRIKTGAKTTANLIKKYLDSSPANCFEH